LFERGREYERGLRPLSPELPSPAIIIRDDLSMLLAGEGFTLVPLRSPPVARAGGEPRSEGIHPEGIKG